MRGTSLIRRFKRTMDDEGVGTAIESTCGYLLGNVPLLSDDDSFKSFAYDAVEENVTEEAPEIIVGGAHKGRSTRRFLRAFDSPTVHAVEPVPESTRVLREKFDNDDSVEVHQVALGEDEDEVEFNVHPHTSSSSVFETSDVFLESDWPDRREDFTPDETITVPQVPIDSISTDPDVIRLDLQGYELQALKGATEALKECRAVLVEISFLPHYEGQNLFLDVHRFLVENGFQIYDMDSWPWFENQMSHGFAVYFSERVYKENDHPVNPFDYR